MLNKIIRFYNQNKIEIISILLMIIVFLSVIYIINYYIKEDNENKLKNVKYENNISDTLQTKSIISNTYINKDTAQENNDIIDQFISLCNENNFNDAYSMLTDDCKDEVFNSNETEFEKNYCNKIFKNKKSYQKDNWISSDIRVTYKIIYTNNILENGGKNSEDSFGDYITIEKKDNYTKLNIANFVGKDEINKNYEDDNILIEVESKDIYIDYETYKVKFTNKSSESVELYNENYKSKWYAEDNKSKKYNVEINEIPKIYFTIDKNNFKLINEKFIKTYSLDREINTLHFENIKLNNEIKNVDLKI